jgi:hypothetical protein
LVEQGSGSRKWLLVGWCNGAYFRYALSPLQDFALIR